jgi:hypothetical protein
MEEAEANSVFECRVRAIGGRTRIFTPSSYRCGLRPKSGSTFSCLVTAKTEKLVKEEESGATYRAAPARTPAPNSTNQRLRGAPKRTLLTPSGPVVLASLPSLVCCAEVMVGQNSRTNLLQVSYCAVYRQVKLFSRQRCTKTEAFADGFDRSCRSQGKIFLKLSRRDGRWSRPATCCCRAQSICTPSFTTWRRLAARRRWPVRHRSCI